jgi:hypothetical protein
VYNVADVTCVTSKLTVGGPVPSHPGPPTAKLEAIQVPFATYIHSTS